MAPSLAGQQETSGVPVGGEVFAGSDLEDYLRLLQIVGEVEPYAWSVRSFAPSAVARLAPNAPDHPWASRYTFAPAAAPTGARVSLLRPEVDVVFNSGFPYGSNDGAVWAGRGMTVALQAGADAHYGPLSLTLYPVAFWSQNSDFRLEPNGQAGDARFGDARQPQYIDLPQRFGNGAYARVDPGQSTLRIDYRGVSAGLSTANQYWGPASRYPLLLGNNAAGFPHAFIGTEFPVNLWIGKLQARTVWGRLEQSDYSMAAVGREVRLMSGLVAVFTPRGLPGVEVGGGRFFHSIWPKRLLSVAALSRPFGSLVKVADADPYDTDPDQRADNQLASVFLRWSAPRSGFEVYGEFAREDYNWNARDLILEPDHDSGYLLGFRKAWQKPGGAIVTLRGELVNTQITDLATARVQAPFYRHAFLGQGHTNRGQILGAANGYGGGGAFLEWSRYSDRGRWSLSWSRDVRDHQGVNLVNPTPTLDVLHSIGGELLQFRGAYEVVVGVRGVYNQNRDLARDVANANATVRVQWRM
jgi:hypothetical protein